MEEGKKINDVEVLDVSAVVDGTLYPVYDPNKPTSASRSSAQQIANYVKSKAAHASEQEDTDQANLASVGKVQELIGDGRRVKPITSTPATPNTDVIYLVHNSDENVTFGTVSVPAGTTARVYYDGNGWVVVTESGDGSVSIDTAINPDSPSTTKAPSSKAVADYFAEQATVVNDSLSSDSTTMALSAKQGKLLGEELFGGSVTLTKNGGFTHDRTNVLINSNGQVVDYSNYFISSKLKIGDYSYVEIETAYKSLSDMPFAQVPATGSTKYTSMNFRHSNKNNKHQYYGYVDAGEYVFNGNVSGVTTITITRVGVRKKLHENVDAIATLTKSEASSKSDTALSTADINLSQGLIKNTGSIYNSSAYSHTDPISLHKYDRIVFKSTNTSTNDTAVISLTDSTGSFYKPVVVGKGNGTSEYVAERDCYVAISHVTASFSSTELNIHIIGGSENHAMGAAMVAERNMLRAKLYDAMPKYNSREMLERNKEIANRRSYAFEEANQEREEALYEIKKLGHDHVCHFTDTNNVTHYLEGSCGYTVTDQVMMDEHGNPVTDSNGNPVYQITDDTIHWAIYDNGVLYIHGHGRMYDFLKGTQKHLKYNELTTTDHVSDWYYGFVDNVNGYVNPYPKSVWKHHADWEAVTYATPRRYFSKSHGDADNPFCETEDGYLPYGYAAPWYPYRRELYRFDKDGHLYETPGGYKSHNPHNFVYDRIVIEEEYNEGNGKYGITYIGMWNFYKCNVKSLILPAHVTTIAEWGVRMSDTLETLILGSKVETCEALVCSRMSNLKYLSLPSSLITIGDDCFGGDYLEYLNIPSLPSTSTSTRVLGRRNASPLDAVRRITLGSGISMIRSRSLINLDNAEVINIPEGVTEIENNAIIMSADNNMSDVILILPATLTTFGTSGIVVDRIGLMIVKGNAPINITPKYLAVAKNRALPTSINPLYDKIHTDNEYDYYYRGIVQ